MPPRRYSAFTTERINATITPQSLLKLILLAEEQDESLSGMLEKVIRDSTAVPTNWDESRTLLESFIYRKKGTFADFVKKLLPERKSSYEKARRRREKAKARAAWKAATFSERYGSSGTLQEMWERRESEQKPVSIYPGKEERQDGDGDKT